MKPEARGQRDGQLTSRSYCPAQSPHRSINLVPSACPGDQAVRAGRTRRPRQASHAIQIPDATLTLLSSSLSTDGSEGVPHCPTSVARRPVLAALLVAARLVALVVALQSVLLASLASALPSLVGRPCSYPSCIGSSWFVLGEIIRASWSDTTDETTVFCFCAAVPGGVRRRAACRCGE
jgi:hypothetical protein